MRGWKEVEFGIMNKPHQQRMFELRVNFALFVLVVLGCLFLFHFYNKYKNTKTATPATTNAVAVTATETNLVPSGTNGLTIVNDVGGTVSFQQSSSRTSAPVAPENPHLNKK